MQSRRRKDDPEILGLIVGAFCRRLRNLQWVGPEVNGHRLDSGRDAVARSHSPERRYVTARRGHEPCRRLWRRSFRQRAGTKKEAQRALTAALRLPGSRTLG